MKFRYKRKHATMQEITDIVGLHRNTVRKHILAGVLDLRDIGSIIEYSVHIKALNAQAKSRNEIRCEIGVN